MARGHYFNYVQQGGNRVSVAGFSSSNTVEKSYPGATVSVYNAGTVTLATLFSDSAGTPKANPFTAGSDGSFDFWTDQSLVDITFSGTGITTSCGAAYPGYPCVSAFTWANISPSGTVATSNAISADSYGALGDGKIIYDAVMSFNSGILDSIAGRFLSTDVGKLIRVENGGAAGVALSTTIASFQSATRVTLTAVCANAAGISGKIAVWGANDTAAIQSAVNALIFASAANNGNGTIIFGDGSGTDKIYLINDTIDFGANLDGVTVTSNGFGYVNGDVDGTAINTYHNISIRWAGAGSTGKPMFWFKNACSFNTVSNLGFYGGDEAVRFRGTSTPTSINDNRVVNCHFSNQAVTSIMIGWALTDVATDNDMAGYVVDHCFFYSTPIGVSANDLNNGYGLYIRDSGFYTGDSGQAVKITNWNNFVMDNCIISKGAGALNGLYQIQQTGGSNTGYYEIRNTYIEHPLLFKGSVAGLSTRGFKMENVSMNTTTVGATEAVDVTGYATVINSTVSTNAVARTIKASSGGTVIGDSAGGAGKDTYTGGKWLKMGLLTGSNTRPILLDFGQSIAALDGSGGTARRIFGIAGSIAQIAQDGDVTLSIGAPAINMTSSNVTQIVTMSSGQGTMNTISVTANSSIIYARRISGGTPGHLSVGSITVSTSSGSLRIDSTSTNESSTVSVLVIN